jgi:dephospho-CoA kinase
VLVIDCDPELQLKRLMLRDATNVEAARGMLAAQADRASRLAIAHDVIHNDGDVAALAPQVEALHRRYLDLPAGLSGSADRTL